jgi:molybdenum cofactor synthesis domain-containing protein
MTIGDEVVEGKVVNTNAAWIVEELIKKNMWPRLVVSVPDSEELIVRMLRIAADTADVLVVSGGLGWTPDDVTRLSVARAVYRDVAVDHELAALIERNSSWANRAIASAAATFPEGASPLTNPLGGVPGFVIRNVYVLPGDPDEMQATFGNVDFGFTAPEIHQHSRTWNITEDRIGNILDLFVNVHPAVRIGSYPGTHSSSRQVTLTLTCRDKVALDSAVAWLEAQLVHVTEMD